MSEIIFHIDVNSAYLSWTAVEELKNGAQIDLRKIPSIIGGNQESRHGVVLAKSIPAKRYGIKTGEPVANALRKCPTLLIKPPDHQMYREYSRKLMGFLKEYTPEIEQVSVDECYMDFTGIAHQFLGPIEAAKEIQGKIREQFGFTVNIGISSNKLLAKMASDFEKPNKIHTLFPEEVEKKMWPLPVSELYMAGRASVRVLEKLEIRTIGELARMDPQLLELHLKSHGRTLWEFANGITHSKVEKEQAQAKGIGNSTTLSRDVTSEAEAQKVLLMLAESVGARLRKAKQQAGMLNVEIKYATFQSASHQRQLPFPTSSDSVLYEHACSLFRELWDKTPIRLLGIRTSKLLDEQAPRQMNLFDYQTGLDQQQKKVRDEKQEKIAQAVDEIRKKYGEHAVMRGTLLASEKKS